MVLRAPTTMAPSGRPEPADRHRPPDDSGSILRRFPAGDTETRAALLAVCERLRSAGLGEDDLSSAELIIAEALNNIVEHAYANSNGLVELSIELRLNGLFCLIRDHGQVMPGGRAPNPPLPQINPPNELPEGGFGWHIIRSLTTELGYRHEDGWNTLSFVVPLTGFD